MAALEPDFAGAMPGSTFSKGPSHRPYPATHRRGAADYLKMPDKPFAIAKETVSVMPWELNTAPKTPLCGTSQTSAAAGNATRALIVVYHPRIIWISYQQPLTYTTKARLGRTTGTFPALKSRVWWPTCRHRSAGSLAADVR